MGLSAGAMLVMAQHHEMADGSGFPQKLNVDRMTAAARIVALVNRYDNLCNPAVPAHALTPHEALSLLFAQGKHQVRRVDARRLHPHDGRVPAGLGGAAHRRPLRAGDHVNSTRPLKPRVLVHDPAVPRDEALHLDLEQHADLGIRRSLRPQQLPPTRCSTCRRASAWRTSSSRRRVHTGLRPGDRGVSHRAARPAGRAGGPCRPGWPCCDSLLRRRLAGRCRHAGAWPACNAAARSLLGLTDVALRGRNAGALIGTPEDLAFWDEVARGPCGRASSPKRWCVATDGRLLQVMRRIAPLQVRGAQPTHYLVVAARPQRAGAPEHERETLLAELQATLESTADGILVTDLAGRIRAFNRRFAQLWDMPRDLLTARRTTRCSTGCGAASATRAAYQRRLAALQESTLCSATDTLQLLSGQVLETRDAAAVCRGRPIGRVCSFRDLTERVDADQRIEALSPPTR